MHKYWRIVVGLFMLLLLFVLSFLQRYVIIEIDNYRHFYVLEKAVTPRQRAYGLMNRVSLRQWQGMIFIFEQDTDNGFWMKNMKFPLDILFFDQDLNFISIHKNVPPCNQHYCPSYYATRPYRYVIELRGDTFKEGDKDNPRYFKLVFGYL